MAEERQELQGLLLKYLKAAKDSEGRDMLAHIQRMLAHVAFHNPTNGIDKFEEISYELRMKGKLEAPERFLNYQALSTLAVPSLQALYERYYEVKKPDGEAGGEPVEPSALCYIPDLVADNEILEYAGLGFGEEESLLLMKSLKKLAQKFEPKSLRLWGKICGSVKDYYIAEGEKEGAGGDVPPEVEARGTGVNRNVYWITNSVTGEWSELPDTLPSTINLARELKVLFTGEPETRLFTNPHFGGKEKELLRAQIARISQMVSIIPKGYFKKQEDSEREIAEVPEEEKKIPEFDDLKRLENWCHFAPNILKCGRTTHLQPEPPKEEPPGYDPAVALKELEIADPYEERLKPLSQDQTFERTQAPWTVKVVGDSHVYKEEFKEATFTNGTIVLKSLVWPGAYIFYKDNRWFNFYIGFGHKLDGKEFYPVLSPIPRVQPVELPEQSEPNPKTDVEGREENENENEEIKPETVPGFIEILEGIIADEERFKKILFSTFDKLDTDHSSELDRKEVRNFLKFFSKELQIPMGTRAIQEFFKNFDTDKSGGISKEEMVEPLKAMLMIWVETLKEMQA